MVAPEVPSSLDDITMGWTPDASSSMSLHADAYTRQRWFDADQRSIIGASWQWICHGEKLRAPGSYVAEEVAGMPTVATRGRDGVLRACLLYTSPSPRDLSTSRMPSSA